MNSLKRREGLFAKADALSLSAGPMLVLLTRQLERRRRRHPNFKRGTHARRGRMKGKDDGTCPPRGSTREGKQRGPRPGVKKPIKGESSRGGRVSAGQHRPTFLMSPASLSARSDTNGRIPCRPTVFYIVRPAALRRATLSRSAEAQITARC